MHVREMILTFRDIPGAMQLDQGPMRVPRQAAAVFTELLGRETVEVFGILCLTTKHGFLGYYEVSRGSLDAALVHPREVFKAALLANAAAVIFGHNHPSGDPTPSADDRVLTTRLVTVGELVGVGVLDHVIVGRDQQYFSFIESGVLPLPVERR